MSYLDPIFLDNINKDNVHLIFELGSRDLLDACKLHSHYGCPIYAFECNPDCLELCETVLASVRNPDIHLIKNAVSLIDGPVSFFPFDLQKYNNMGASSMLKIDFSMRSPDDPDYNRACPQTEIVVEGTRLDTFIIENQIVNVDLLCIDLQGYELNALKSLGQKLSTVKYIITECSIQNTYEDGAAFIEIMIYLSVFGFEYRCSNRFGYKFPDTSLKGFSEFDALFTKSV